MYCSQCTSSFILLLLLLPPPLPPPPSFRPPHSSLLSPPLPHHILTSKVVSLKEDAPEPKASGKHEDVVERVEEAAAVAEDEDEDEEEGASNNSSDAEEDGANPLDLSKLPGFYMPAQSTASTRAVIGTFCSGLNAAASAAYTHSDMVFVYHTGDAGRLAGELTALVEAGHANVFGRVPLVEMVETRSGAGTVAAGAHSVGNLRISVVASSQSLPLMIPSMMQIASGGAPCVFHASIQKVSSTLALAADVAGVIAVRDTGFAITASYTIQEASDMAHISHAAAIACGSPVLHVFDGADLARASTHIRSAPAPCSENVSHAICETPLEALQGAMQAMEGSLQRRYQFFEYHGAADATQVVVVFGVGASIVQDMVDSLVGSGQRVGVVVVRVFRPWSTDAFVQALPLTAKQISVATVSSNVEATGAMLADVVSSIHGFSKLAQKEKPSVISAHIVPGTYGSSQQKFAEVFRNMNLPSPNLSLRITDESASYAVVPAAIPRAGAQRTMTIWGTDHVKNVLGHVQSMLTATGGLCAHIKVDKDTYHAKAPVRAVATFAPTLISNGPQTASSDLVVVNDVTVLSTHGIEIVSALNPSTTSILAVNTDGVGSAGVPVNVSQCLSTLLGQVPRQVKVLAFSPSAISNGQDLSGITTDEVVAAAVVSLFEVQSPTLNNITAASVLNALSVPSADSFAKHLSASFKDITTELDSLDEDPENLNATTITLEGSDDYGQSLTPRIPTLPTKKGSAAASTPLDLDCNLVKTHQVAWNMLFNNDMDCNEAFRPYEEKEVFQVKLTKNQRLTPDDYHRNVFHLEFDTTGTGLEYQIGESLGVYGHNDAKEVADFLEYYGVDPNEFVALNGGAKHDDRKQELLTVRQIFTQRLDLFGKPSQDFYAALVPHTSSNYQQKRLKWLGSADKEGVKLRGLESYTFADILYEFQTAHPPLAELIKLIPPIKARHYSISSSMKMHPNSVHLLVVEVDWKTPKGRTRHGQCTRYLAGLNPETHGGEISVAVDIMTSVMTLPEDPMKPVIGAALGTGLAPFRAFIQERRVLKSRGIKLGPFVLYFGARFRAQEFLYGDDLEAAEKEGILELRLAFSRDQKEKVYIQHLIVEDREKLGKYLLDDTGSFYLCGPTWPVPDVRKALCDGIAQPPKTYEDAEAYIDQMKAEGRYVLEVY